MSKYTAHQIYALGQFIIANQKYFPSYQIGQQIRHLEFNAQRNLPEASEEYFRKYLHTTVEKAMEEAAKVQSELTQPPKETHAPPTSKPEPPKRRVAVFTPCATCGKDVAVAEDDLNEAEAKGWSVFCDAKCQEKKNRKINKLVAESDKFLAQVGAVYLNCEYNTKLLIAYLRERKKEITCENLIDAFYAIGPQLLMKLTPKEILEMTDEEYDKRARLEGSYQSQTMGGVDLRTISGQKPEQIIFSSNKVRTNNLPLQGFTGGGR